jgi:hypothetical protein
LAKYNRERRHFGQNTMEKSVKVSAKYIQKKHVGQNTIEKEGTLGKIQWPKITVGVKCNGESVQVSAQYIQTKTHSRQNI